MSGDVGGEDMVGIHKYEIRSCEIHPLLTASRSTAEYRDMIQSAVENPSKALTQGWRTYTFISFIVFFNEYIYYIDV